MIPHCETCTSKGCEVCAGNHILTDYLECECPTHYYFSGGDTCASK